MLGSGGFGRVWCGVVVLREGFSEGEVGCWRVIAEGYVKLVGGQGAWVVVLGEGIRIG